MWEQWEGSMGEDRGGGGEGSLDLTEAGDPSTTDRRHRAEPAACG